MKLKLVIDIDEELYNYIKSDVYDEHKDRRFDFKIRQSIKNATPLPKGHGRLIDADAVTKDFNTFQDSFVINMADLGMGKISIECLAPTIIEADKGDKE